MNRKAEALLSGNYKTKTKIKSIKNFSFPFGSFPWAEFWVEKAEGKI